MSDPKPTSSIGERPGCVIGIALGILILGSIIAWIALPKTEARDGAQLMATWFAGEGLPEGYAIDDARKLMGGEEVVKLLDTSSGEEAARKPAPSSTDETPLEWGRVELGAHEQAPRWLMFVRYPLERGDADIRRLFAANLKLGRPDEIGKQGGRMLLEIGTLKWGAQDPAFVLERDFEAGGTFHDVVRVNLSTPTEPLILHAQWSRSQPFSKARLEALLATLSRP
jgi:hypothetical protein